MYRPALSWGCSMQQLPAIVMAHAPLVGMLPVSILAGSHAVRHILSPLSGRHRALPWLCLLRPSVNYTRGSSPSGEQGTP